MPIVESTVRCGFALLVFLLAAHPAPAQPPGGEGRRIPPILETAPPLATPPSGIGSDESLPPGEPVSGESPGDRVRALFDRLGEAYREEDAGKIGACFDPAAPNYERVMKSVGWFLRGSNYFRIDMEPVRLEERANRVEGEVLVGWSFRLVTESGDRYLRDRVRMVLWRRGGRDVFRVYRSLPPRQVGFGNPVAAERFDLRVRLHPDESSLDVEGVATLRNRGTEPVSSLALEMAPLVEGFRATAPSGGEIEVEGERGATFYAALRLPEPIPPGTDWPVGFRYTIRFPGRNESDHVGSADAYLVNQTAWFPRFRPGPDPAAPSYDFDLQVTAPAGYRVASTGVSDPPSEPAGGVQTWRFRSAARVSQIPLVAGRFESESRKLCGGRLPVTVLLYPGAPRDGLEPFLSKVAEMLAWLEERLGPVPAPSLVVAPIRPPALYANGPFFAVGRSYLESPGFQDEHKDLFTNWLAHHLAHLWFVSGIRASGTGEMFLREGFSNYFDLTILDDFLSEGARASLLRNRKDTFRNSAGDDQALAEVTDITPGWEMLMADKAPVVVAMIRNWLGEDLFRSGLKVFFETYRGREAGLGDLEASLAAQDPTVRDLFSDCVYGKRMAEPGIAGVESADDPSGGSKTVLLVRNDGRGRAAVPVELRPSQGGSVYRTVRLAPGEEAAVEVTTPDPVTFIRLDPFGEVLELRSGDNEWPSLKPLRKRNFPPVKVPGALPDPYGPRRPGSPGSR